MGVAGGGDSCGGGEGGGCSSHAWKKTGHGRPPCQTKPKARRPDQLGVGALGLANPGSHVADDLVHGGGALDLIAIARRVLGIRHPAEPNAPKHFVLAAGKVKSNKQSVMEAGPTRRGVGEGKW